MLTTYHGLVSYDIGQTIQQETHSSVSAGGKDEILILPGSRNSEVSKILALLLILIILKKTN